MYLYIDTLNTLYIDTSISMQECKMLQTWKKTLSWNTDTRKASFGKEGISYYKFVSIRAKFWILTS